MHVPRLYTRETFWALQLLVPQLFAKRNATGTRRLHVHTRHGWPWYLLVHVFSRGRRFGTAPGLGRYRGGAGEHRFLRSFGYQDEPTATRSLVLPSSLRRSTPRLAHNPDGQPGGRCALRRWDASSLPGVEQKASIGTWHLRPSHEGKASFSLPLICGPANLIWHPHNLSPDANHRTSPIQRSAPCRDAGSAGTLCGLCYLGPSSMGCCCYSTNYGYYTITCTPYYVLGVLHIATHGPVCCYISATI